MKKIILAVASVLALGLVVGCKQQIEGSLNVTSTNFNKSLDPVTTTKTYVYSVSGSVTSKGKYVMYDKAGKFNRVDTTTTTVWTPNKDDITVTETTNPYNNKITYRITINGSYITTTETITKSTSEADPVKEKEVSSKTTNTQTVTIDKIDNKFYIKNQDNTYKVVEGVDFSAAEIDLSKFNDETSTETVTGTEESVPVKTTNTSYGYTYDLKLTRK